MSQSTRYILNQQVCLFLLTLLLSSSFLANAGCIHDTLKVELQEFESSDEDSFDSTESPHQSNDDGSQQHTQDHDHGRMLYTPQNIRIYLDYSNLVVTGKVADFIRNILMPATVSYYSSTLKVNYPIVGALTFKTSMTKCTDQAQIPIYLRTTGVQADLVLFVTAAASDDDYIAYAVPCATDKYGRPMAGEVSFNLNNVDPYDSTQILSQISTVLHETAHVLGFSSALFSRYIDPNYPTVKLGVSKVYSTVNRNGVSVNTIILPPVLTRAKAYFNCDSLEGLDLEDEGSTGSAGSHWERKILYNEVMTASDIVDVRFTEFTLALLEGTGWYTPDYTKADPMTWGKGRGCNFIKSSCEPGGKAAFPEFCTPSTDDQGCSWGGQYKGACLMQSGVPNANYNYFGNSLVTLDSFVDNCPYFFAYESQGTCNSPTTPTSSSYFPEAFGSSSSCFQSTLRYSSKFSTALTSKATGCFSSTCTLSGANYVLTVTIGSQTITCSGAASAKSVTGFVGSFYCPDANVYCGARANSFCNYGCLGRGTCVNNKCVCSDGWSGAGCETPTLVKGCSRCSSSTPNCYGDTCISASASVSTATSTGTATSTDNVVSTSTSTSTGTASSASASKAMTAEIGLSKLGMMSIVGLLITVFLI